MKRAVLLLAAAVLVGALPDSKYTDKFDNIDIDEVLNNQRLLNQYIACLKGKGKCSPDGNYIKEVLPESMQTDCAKCSDMQKERSMKVVKHLVEKRPADFKALEELYDPQCAFRKKWHDEYATRGIEIGSC